MEFTEDKVTITANGTTRYTNNGRGLTLGFGGVYDGAKVNINQNNKAGDSPVPEIPEQDSEFNYVIDHGTGGGETIEVVISEVGASTAIIITEFRR